MKNRARLVLIGISGASLVFVAGAGLGAWGEHIRAERVWHFQALEQVFAAHDKLVAGDTDTTKAFANRAIALMPRWYYPFMLLGEAYELEGAVDKAKRCYEKAFSLLEEWCGPYGKHMKADLPILRERIARI